MTKAWLALGANIGDAKQNINTALRLIEQNPLIKINKRSKMIITPAWGKEDQNDFHNMVIEIKTDIYPETLLKVLLQIEKTMGRERGEKWGPRIIDIDIVAIDRFEVKTSSLILPHPHAFERDFVLDPLREISPQTADWIIKLAKSPK